MSAPIKRPKWSKEEIQKLLQSIPERKIKCSRSRHERRDKREHLDPVLNRVSAILTCYAPNSTVPDVKWLREIHQYIVSRLDNIDRRNARARELRADRLREQIARQIEQAKATIRRAADLDALEDDLRVVARILKGESIYAIAAEDQDACLTAVVDRIDRSAGQCYGVGDFSGTNREYAIAQEVEDLRRKHFDPHAA